MGAWDELDTEIRVTINIPELDDFNNLDDPYGIFEDVRDYVNNVKEAINEGGKDGASQVATIDRSLQQQALQKCKNPSGILASSIEEEEQDEGLVFIVGTIINHIYPMSIEFGRGPVYPIPPKTRLRYYGEGGYLIYPLSAGPADPVPYVQPAYDSTRQIAEQIVFLNVMHRVNDIK